MPATHVRTQLRSAVATLVTGLATTGPRVFQTRMPPQRLIDLPCLLVYAGDETVERGGGTLQDRALEIIVRGVAVANTGLDATLDQIALEVETALAADGRLTLKSIETDLDEALEKPAGVIAMTYTTPYFTHAGNPGVSA